MSMFDDLDPDFLSSPGPALPIVAARVYAIRRRRWVVAASAVGAIAVFILGSMVLGGGGKNPERLTVSRKVTTTTDGSSDIYKPLLTAPTTTAASTSTTVAATTTTATLPIAPTTTTTSPRTTTTARTPAHFTLAFDRTRLVIQSGTIETISYTVTNDGGKRGLFEFLPDCAHHSVWPDDQSMSHPIAWAAPVDLSPNCSSLGLAEISPHASRRLRVTVVAGLLDGSGNLVPSPPGQASFPVRNLGSGGGGAQLPVTITPPATPPLTIDHPSQVTTASGAQNEVDFTITNNLPFPVAFVDQGPCAHGGEEACARTFPHSARDLRLAPYDNADVPLWTTRFVLGAHETRMATASVNGVANLGGNSSSSPALPPGGYHFDWDGEKVAFTVT